MATVVIPAHAEHFELDWCVEEGAEVNAGQTVAWLCAPGRCALEPLTVPEAGRLVARWASVLRVARPGEAVASTTDAARVKGQERARLAGLVAELTKDREALVHRRTGRSGAGAALLDRDLARIDQVLQSAHARLHALEST